MSIDLVTADAVKWANEYDGPLFHAFFADCPYHLTTITKRFGKEGSAPAQFGKDGAFARASKGFMGQCYHPSTEVLTDKGWLNIADIVDNKIDCLYYSLEPETKSIELVSAGEFHKYSYSGNLYHFTGRSVDLLVTPNHHIVVQRESGYVSFVKAEQLPESFKLFNYGNWESGENPETIQIGEKVFDAYTWMRFLGIFLGDGCVVNRKNQPQKQDFISIAARKERKRITIAMVCDQLGIKYTQYATNTYIYDKDIQDHLRPLGKSYDKYIPEQYFRLSCYLLKGLLRGLLETDGYINKNGKCTQYFTCSQRLADDVQRLALLCKMSATLNIRFPDPGRIIDGRATKTSRTQYILTFLLPNRSLWFEKIDHKSKQERLKMVEYDGFVYDIGLTKNHILMVRRNGRTVWSSNSWDGGDVAFRPETWYAFGKVLYPGAFGIAYASSRGYHRMATAIEDSGMILHPLIGWVQAQGMPKATRIDTQIDKQAGKEREVLYSYKRRGRSAGIMGKDVEIMRDITEPATDLAKAWVGHRYGLQALAPSLEPICVFQKPYEGRPLDNITQTGAGALNIDATRIPSAEPYTINTWDDDAHPFGDGAGNPYTSRQESGRWPKNLILDAEVAEILDKQSGVSKSTGGRSGHTTAYGGGYKQEYYGDQKPGYGDTGTVSRFFFQVQNQLDEADPIRYCPKVSPRERNEGLDDLPDQLYAQSGGAPARLQDGDEEYKQDSMGMNRIQKVKNPHPTLKPISLNEYLAKLLLPPALYAPRRLFNPFAGVASEAIGAYLAGWDEIVGVEWKPDYVEIGRKRIVYWTGKPRQLKIV